MLSCGCLYLLSLYYVILGYDFLFVIPIFGYTGLWMYFLFFCYYESQMHVYFVSIHVNQIVNHLFTDAWCNICFCNSCSRLKLQLISNENHANSP